MRWLLLIAVVLGCSKPPEPVTQDPAIATLSARDVKQQAQLDRIEKTLAELTKPAPQIVMPEPKPLTTADFADEARRMVGGLSDLEQQQLAAISKRIAAGEKLNPFERSLVNEMTGYAFEPLLGPDPNAPKPRPENENPKLVDDVAALLLRASQR